MHSACTQVFLSSLLGLPPTVLASDKVSDLTFQRYAETYKTVSGGVLKKAMLLFFGHNHPHVTIQSPVATGDIWR